MTLTRADWTIAALMVGGLIWAGYYGRSLVRSVAQFTIAGRGTGTWLGISTGAAEAMGLICIATGVQTGFTSGFSWMWVSMSMTIMSIILFGILGLGIMRYRATNVHTLPQYFEMRYSRGLRIFSGISLSVGGVLNMAIFPIVESHFLIAFLGLPPVVHPLGPAMPTFAFVLSSMLDRGADRIYLFNYMDDGAGGPPHYQALLREIGNLETLAGKPRRHVLTYADTWAPGEPRAYPLPARCSAGGWAAFRIHTGPRPRSGEAIAALGIVGDTLVEKQTLQVRVNGELCRFTGPCDLPQPKPDFKVHGFAVPLAQMNRGYNLIEVTPRKEVTFGWVEFSVRQ
jgi:SSS family solute:Na+ symporter